MSVTGCTGSDYSCQLLFLYRKSECFQPWARTQSPSVLRRSRQAGKMNRQYQATLAGRKGCGLGARLAGSMGSASSFVHTYMYRCEHWPVLVLKVSPNFLLNRVLVPYYTTTQLPVLETLPPTGPTMVAC